MDFEEFQRNARATDVSTNSLVPLLGMAGEIGSLYSVYKKKYRDKPSHDQFLIELKEELGDLLWYIAAIANKNEIGLNEIAEKNIRKTQEFFGPAEAPDFDGAYLPNEQFPDFMRVEFRVGDDGRLQMFFNGEKLGDSLSDNSHIEDNYKFHDAFHLAFLAHLHWSPNMRRLLRRKRKSSPLVDENEDGARACAVEEGAAAIAFSYASQANFFQSVDMVPLKLVTLLIKMTENFEVSRCRSSSWRHAISDGARAFNFLSDNKGGIVEINVRASTMEWRKA